MTGQWAVAEAVRRRLTFQTDEKAYALNDGEIATLVIRPRGWHLDEAHVLVDGSPISASLFDFGPVFFHNAREQLARGSGPYFYLPKLESHLEAELWNDVFVAAQEGWGSRRAAIRATVLIETILAAFEMEEILYELRDHAAGLNAGRWDYIFSLIKKLRGRPGHDPARTAPRSPWRCRSCAPTELLVATCHRRGAHAIGGMSAFIPNRREPEVTERAGRGARGQAARGRRRVGRHLGGPSRPGAGGRRDLRRGAGRAAEPEGPLAAGIAHRRRLARRRHRRRGRHRGGVRTNVSVALQYLASWLAGKARRRSTT